MDNYDSDELEQKILNMAKENIIAIRKYRTIYGVEHPDKENIDKNIVELMHFMTDETIETFIDFIE